VPGAVTSLKSAYKAWSPDNGSTAPLFHQPVGYHSFTVAPVPEFTIRSFCGQKPTLLSNPCLGLRITATFFALVR
jgi:hypothetical protein